MASPLRDPTGKWEKQIRKLAKDLGYEWRGVFFWWEQIASAREFARTRMRLDRAVHEDSAYRDCEIVFDQRGRTPD